MITQEQIEEFNKLKQDIKRMELREKELNDLFKKAVQDNHGEALKFGDYEVTITIGQRTGCAGHEKFKEILGPEAYQTLFEKGLINTTPTQKLGVKKI